MPSLENLTSVTGGAGPGQGDDSSASPEVQTPLFRWTLPPAQAKEDGEEHVERVLRLDQAQEEGLREDNAKRRQAQEREAGALPIELGVGKVT